MSSWLAKAMNAALTIKSNKDSIKRYTIDLTIVRICVS